MKNICVVTGARAEYGLLKPLLYRIKSDEELQLLLVVTGMHLSEEFGLTYHEIENDGFYISHKIDMLINSDTPSDIVKSMSIELRGFADLFQNKKIDMMIVLGDRYEILIASIAAMMFRIPIAHIHGGELTEGAIDDAIRHAITKMSTLHFVATDEYRNRVIQLGENPENVFNVGALGVENAKNIKFLAKEQLEEELNFRFGTHTAIVTFHPVTLDNSTPEEQFTALLCALDHFPDMKVIFTKANADTGGRKINQLIDGYVQSNRDKRVSFFSMGQLRYLSALCYCSLVIGNSSSGIIEAPSFGIPTVDIGNRQKGRIRASSVLHCEPIEEEIIKVISIVLTHEIICKGNPYEKTGTSRHILEYIKQSLSKSILYEKKFYDLY